MGDRVPRRGRPSLAERSAAMDKPRPAPARHCWVADTADPAARWPGLLLEWRRGGDGRWMGRVAYAVTDGDQSVLIVAWTPQEALSP